MAPIKDLVSATYISGGHEKTYNRYIHAEHLCHLCAQMLDHIFDLNFWQPYHPERRTPLSRRGACLIENDLAVVIMPCCFVLQKHDMIKIRNRGRGRKYVL